MKKFFFSVLISIIGQFNCFATFQVPDILIFNNDTLSLNESPLETLPKVCEEIRSYERSGSSSCWNGFTAEWIIIGNNLYLKNIYSYSTKKNINNRLEKIINQRFKNGLLKAEWFSGSFYGGFGRYLNQGYFFVYEKERLFSFEKGVSNKIVEYNAENIEFSINPRVVINFIYENFNWNLVDTTGDLFKRVSVFIKANTLGNLKEIKFEESGGEIIDKEIERVLKLIPNWGVYYWNGEKYEFFNSYEIEISNKQKKKYSNL